MMNVLSSVLTNIWKFINTNLGIAVISAIITFIFTSLGYFLRLRSKQKGQYDEIIGGKIASALDIVRNIELETKSIDYLDFEELLKDQERNLDFFEGEAIYPAIMESSESFLGFFDEINKARADCEKYLNYNVAVYLYYMERYCVNVMGYLRNNPVRLDLLGSIIVSDIQKWQRECDKEIVKSINHPHYKLYSFSNDRWEKTKERIMKQLWENSLLCGLMNDKDSPVIKVAKAILTGSPETEELIEKLCEGDRLD